MRKSSSQPGPNKRPGSDSTFSDGPRKAAKPFKKKNYDGRGTSDTNERGPSRPYSGRTTDSDKGAGKPYGKRNSFDDRKPRTEKPFSDRSAGGEGAKGKPFEKRGSFDDRKPRGERTYEDRRTAKPAGKPFEKRGPSDDRKPRGERPYEDRRTDKPAGKPYEKRDSSDDRKPRSERPYEDRRTDKPAGKPYEKRGPSDDRKPRGERPFRDNKTDGDTAGRKPFEKRDSFDKPAFKKHKTDAFKKPGKSADSRPFRERQKPQPEVPEIPDEVSFSKDIDDAMPGKYNTPAPDTKPYNKAKRLPSDRKEQSEKKPLTASGKRKHYHNHDHDDDEDEEDKEINQTNGPRLEMPLNKYIAHSGECSRRDAANLVREGKVKVNGELVLDPGYRVLHDDKVTMSGKKLTPQKGMVYLLLNKPKGFITTNEDPQGRKTVMELVANSGVERLFPVGRLDRDTSGLLLITNDGDLTQKLCHPSYNIKKVYQVTLDKPLTKADFDKIMAGVELEDGKAIVDEMAWLDKKNELGLEIHSGRNRIVRRIFESLGYVVEKLDRMMYAGLTKKNLPRGKWRYLDAREVVLLKHFKS